MSTAFSEERWQHEIRKQGCPNDLGPLGIQKHQLPLRALTWSLGQGRGWPTPGLKRTGILHVLCSL